MSAGLRRYIVIRILLTIPMILILVTIVFFVMRVLPGDPAVAVLRDGATEEQLAAYRELMGLDKPITEQYIEFLSGLIRFDFGQSLSRPRSVIEEITTFLPATIELAFFSMLVIAGLGIFPGAFAAQHRKSAADYSIRVISIILYSIPIFWLGLMFQMFFGAKI